MRRYQNSDLKVQSLKLSLIMSNMKMSYDFRMEDFINKFIPIHFMIGKFVSKYLCR